MTTSITINGDLLIGASVHHGSAAAFRAIDPATGVSLEPAFGGASLDDADRACTLAQQAFDSYRETSPKARAAFLEQIAQNILDLGPVLIERAMQESGLPQARLEGERGYTVGQLRLFAKVVRAAASRPVLAQDRPRPGRRVRRQ